MKNFSDETMAILRAADHLRASLSVARGLVLSGREVDLAGLDGEVMRLCAAAACADRAAHPALRDALAEAVREVEGLQAAIGAA